MNNKYINIYNNLVNLTRNKDLYKDFTEQDSFSDRLLLFLLHFAFFLKVFKNDNDKKTLQEIYDHIFRHLELSIREIGYGDVTINKKMKTYINTFHSLLNKIEIWEDLTEVNRDDLLRSFFNYEGEIKDLSKYFEKYRLFLIKSSLNLFTKGVIKLDF